MRAVVSMDRQTTSKRRRICCRHCLDLGSSSGAVCGRQSCMDMNMRLKTAPRRPPIAPSTAQSRSSHWLLNSSGSAVESVSIPGWNLTASPASDSVLRSSESVKHAMLVHARHLHSRCCEKYVVASSSAKRTPPIGAPNAAAKPAAAPSLIKSLRSASADGKRAILATVAQRLPLGWQTDENQREREPEKAKTSIGDSESQRTVREGELASHVPRSTAHQ